MQDMHACVSMGRKSSIDTGYLKCEVRRIDGEFEGRRKRQKKKRKREQISQKMQLGLERELVIIPSTHMAGYTHS